MGRVVIAVIAQKAASINGGIIDIIGTIGSCAGRSG
jgi:hypothetical protein